MDYFVGLDVGVEDTALCVVDVDGGVLLQTEVPIDPQAIAGVVKPYRRTLRRAGHEAGALSPWLQAELLALGLPVICVEACHARAAMSAQRNKTDAADALGLAHTMRTGWFKRAHMKAEGTYKLRLLLTHRRNLKRKFLDIENAIRHSLKAFGIRIKGTGRAGFEKRIRELTADEPFTRDLIGTMLDARAGLWTQFKKLDSQVVKITRETECLEQSRAGTASDGLSPQSVRLKPFESKQIELALLQIASFDMSGLVHTRY